MRKVKAAAIAKSFFTLKREGTFTVRTYGDNHCGTSENLTIRYKLITKCSADSLDDRGFLFDQTNVDRFFQGQKATALSCEMYTVSCGRELYRMITAENNGCKVREFELTLSPAPYAAELTFSYTA